MTPEQLREDEPVCKRCEGFYVLRDGQDPTPYCDKCAHIELAAALEEIERLKHDLTRSAETNAELATRSEKAEAERDALKRHAVELFWIAHYWLPSLWQGGATAAQYSRDRGTLERLAATYINEPRAEFKGE